MGEAPLEGRGPRGRPRGAAPLGHGGLPTNIAFFAQCRLTVDLLVAGFAIAYWVCVLVAWHRVNSKMAP